MNCVSVYKCLGDETRLRILNLLQAGPLCVCHVQAALQLPQPKVSKQLNYMKRHGLLTSRRRNNWTIYAVADEPGPLLEANLRCLQERHFGDAQFKSDRAALERIDTSVACDPGDSCC